MLQVRLQRVLSGFEKVNIYRDKRWEHAAMVGALIFFDRGDPCESGNLKILKFSKTTE